MAPQFFILSPGRCTGKKDHIFGVHRKDEAGSFGGFILDQGTFIQNQGEPGKCFQNLPPENQVIVDHAHTLSDPVHKFLKLFFACQVKHSQGVVHAEVIPPILKFGMLTNHQDFVGEHHRFFRTNKGFPQAHIKVIGAPVMAFCQVKGFLLVFISGDHAVNPKNSLNRSAPT